MALVNQDLSDVRVGGSSATVPEGTYRAVISGDDYRATAAGNGRCLHVYLTIITGEYQGHELRDFLTLEHPNAQTVRIARESLKRIAVATGHPTPDHVEDTEAFWDTPINVTVSRVKASGDFGDDDGFENRVKKYEAAE